MEIEELTVAWVDEMLSSQHTVLCSYVYFYCQFFNLISLSDYQANIFRRTSKYRSHEYSNTWMSVCPFSSPHVMMLCDLYLLIF